MRKTFLIIVSILGLCIATLILVYSIVWLAFDEFFERPDNIRYTVVSENSVGYIDDLKYHVRLQVQGQSFFKEKNIIYSYGPSGFVIIDPDSRDIKVCFDDTTNSSLKEELVGASKKNIEEHKVKKAYLQIVSFEDLTDNEKAIYKVLKNRKDIYPYLRIY